MKFKFTKKVEGEVISYGNMVKTGDVVDLEGNLAERAAINPNYEKVEEASPTMAEAGVETVVEPETHDENADTEVQPSLDDLASETKPAPKKRGRRKKAN